MAHIVGASVRVVDAQGLSIDELVGNVSTTTDQLSVASVVAAKGTAEPWLTLHYDEWMCVTQGCMTIQQAGAQDLSVPAGQTVMIPRGTRFKPCFPENTAYIPVCIPAFRPDRCIREDEDAAGEAISAKLQALHQPAAGQPEEPRTLVVPEVLYHMLPLADWDAAKAAEAAYFPRTFEQDDFLTHATGVPERLVTTANHYYQDVPGAWVCLEFTRTDLRRRGIVVRDEEATPVGDIATSAAMDAWVCPHVIGGLPLDAVTKTWVMVRDGKRFVRIEGLTE